MRKSMSVFGLCLGAAVIITSWMAGGYVSSADAQSCRPGWWMNSDGTCTRKGWYHCNVNGVNWQCPGRAGRCRLSKGQKLCVP